MSNTLPPLTIPTTRRRNDSSASNVSLPLLSNWSDGTRAMSSFSSPPRSSSPPMTPFSSTSGHHAFIRSSPAFGLEINRNTSHDDIREFSTPWDGPKPAQHSDTPVTLPGIKSLFSGKPSVSFSTRFGASKLPNAADPSFPNNHRNHSRDQASHYVPVFCDSEEEEEQDDESDGYSFVEECSRATFFRTSAERGQWRYERPTIQLPTQPRTHLRQSAPTSSPPPVSGLRVLPRPISEPAPSPERGMTPPAIVVDSHEEEQGASEVPSPSSLLPDQDPSAAYDASGSRPEARGSMEPEGMHCPSSPLPSSSPPPSSMPSSPMMRSISPLSFAPSSPILPPSSPLSFADSLPSEEIELESDNEEALTPDPEIEPLRENGRHEDIPDHVHQASEDLTEVLSCSQTSLSLPMPPSPPQELHVSSASEDIALDAATSHRSPSPTVPETLDATATGTDDELTGLQLGGDIGDNEMPAVPETTIDDVMNVVPEAEVMDVTVSETRAKGKGREIEALRLKDENGVEGPSTGGVQATGTLKVKRKKKQSSGMDEPARKKVRLGSEESLSSGSCVSTGVEKVRKEGKRSLEDDDDENKPVVKVKKQKKIVDGGGSSKRSSPSLPTTSTAPSKPSKSKSKNKSSSTSTTTSDASKHPTPASEPKDPVDAEMCGMLIESMATSRASSLTASALYKSIMQVHPALKAQRTEHEWMEVVERVLAEGEAGRGNGVFGKVESSFKDDSDRALEAQWFYVPELDMDQERATLIRSMMPRAGKRSETKKYKQYYYRPLAKISRWDPEDEM